MTVAVLPDVLVVGAGGSGAPLARRLAERGARVLLLEAGAVNDGPAARESVSLTGAVPGHPRALAYVGELFPGRPHTVVRGQGAGGSTATNAGYFRRARTHDFDAWAADAGDERWRPSSVAAALARLESDQEFGAAAGHGAAGPMPVSRAELAHPLSAALVHAGLSLGLPLEPDKNASPEMPPGVGSTPTNTLAGYRWSTARAYLENAPGELEVRGGHQVVRIVFRHGRAVGVRVIHAGQVMTVYAGLIVLSAGALASPHLLMLSGIGPANVLHGREIPVIGDSPAVGTRLDDHANIDVRFSVPRPLLDYPVTAPVGVSVHASSGLPDSVDGDLEVLSLLRPLGRMLGTDLADEHMSLLVSPLRRSARGTLELDPIDVTAPPHLRFHYAETAPERAGLRAAVRLAAELLDTVPLREVGARAEDPRLTLLDDHELDEWVRAHLLTALHTCATTPMGTAPETSVVDGRGAVHGVTGLHIADVGILPRTPTGGPAATAVLIGEVIADALTSARGDRAGSTASTS